MVPNAQPAGLRRPGATQNGSKPQVCTVRITDRLAFVPEHPERPPLSLHNAQHNAGASDTPCCSPKALQPPHPTCPFHLHQKLAWKPKEHRETGADMAKWEDAT